MCLVSIRVERGKCHRFAVASAATRGSSISGNSNSDGRGAVGGPRDNSDD